MKKKINLTNDEIAYNFYHSVKNREEWTAVQVWNNNKYYNGDGIYREPKLDTMEEQIEFIKEFNGNLTAMAYLNYINSLRN